MRYFEITHIQPRFRGWAMYSLPATFNTLTRTVQERDDGLYLRTLSLLCGRGRAECDSLGWSLLSCAPRTITKSNFTYSPYQSQWNALCSKVPTPIRLYEYRRFCCCWWWWISGAQGAAWNTLASLTLLWPHFRFPNCLRFHQTLLGTYESTFRYLPPHLPPPIAPKMPTNVAFVGG
jgi:hypothetical protein